MKNTEPNRKARPNLCRDFNEVLVESIDETITALLSRTVVDALYAHLQTNHSVSKDEMPYQLDTLFTTLSEIFGVRSSQTITNAISKKFYLKLGLEFTDHPSRTLLEYVDEAKSRLQTSSK
jgi:hypothetical protein